MKLTGTSGKLVFSVVTLVALMAITAMFAGCGLMAKMQGADERRVSSALNDSMGYEQLAEAPMEAMDADMARMAAPTGGSVSATGDTTMVLDVIASAEAAENRKVIKTAELNIEVQDIAGAQKQVQDVVEAGGGFIADLDVQDYGTRVDASIVARVPSANFSEIYEQVKALGSVKRDRMGGQDVTEEYMDLEGRIANKKVAEERLRELFAKAGKIPDLLEVERELSRVRGEIESLQGRLRYLKDQVGFSTITISLYQLGEAPVDEPEGWRLGYHIMGAFRGLLGAIQWLVTAGIYILISGAVVWIPLLLIILWIRRVVRRRRAQRMAQAQVPPQE